MVGIGIDGLAAGFKVIQQGAQIFNMAWPHNAKLAKLKRQGFDAFVILGGCDGFGHVPQQHFRRLAAIGQ